MNDRSTDELETYIWIADLQTNDRSREEWDINRQMRDKPIHPRQTNKWAVNKQKRFQHLTCAPRPWLTIRALHDAWDKTHRCQTYWHMISIWAVRHGSPSQFPRTSISPREYVERVRNKLLQLHHASNQACVKKIIV